MRRIIAIPMSLLAILPAQAQRVLSAR